MDLLQKFEQRLIDAKSPIKDHFYSGLGKKEILNALSGINLIPNDSLIRLYEWHNGINFSVSDFDFWGFNGGFIPIEESLNCYFTRIEKWWKIESENDGKYLFPISFDDDFMVFLKPDSDLFGSIFTVSSGMLIAEPIMIFDSIESLFLSVDQCFENGIYFFNKEGFIEVDIFERTKVFKLLNPGSAYWRYSFPGN
jgi:hypothetical protein